MGKKADYAALAIPKQNPDHQPSQKKQNQTAYKTLRPRVREDTFNRDGGRCRLCHKVLGLLTDDPFKLAHIHETEGPRHEAAIDVSLRSTCVLCHECHIENVEKNRVKVEYESDELRCNGRLYFTGRMRSGRVLDRYASDPVVPFERFRAYRAFGSRE